MYISRSMERAIEKIDKVKWLKRLGGRLIISSGDNWGCLSPFRRESNPSFFMHKKSGLWIDQAKTEYKGNFVQFVAMRWGQIPGHFDRERVISEEEAWEIICADLDIKPGESAPVSELRLRLKDLQEEGEQKSDIEPLGLPGEFDWATNHEQAMEYLLEKRKLSEETVKKHQLGFCSRGFYKNRIIIPVESNEVVWGFAARSIDKEAERKILYPKGFKSSNFLTGIEDHIDKDILILNEGWFDYAFGDQNLQEMGLSEVAGNLCCWGINFSLRQRELLYLAKPKEIVIAFDNDSNIHKSGQRAAENLIESFKALEVAGVKISRFNLPDGKDPNDCTAEEWKEGFSSRKANRKEDGEGGLEIARRFRGLL